jgi:hypothetical protein
MSDAKECRAHAAQCIDMANDAGGNVKLQATLYDLAETWLQLAVQAERAEARNGGSGPGRASSQWPF